VAAAPPAALTTLPLQGPRSGPKGRQPAQGPALGNISLPEPILVTRPYLPSLVELLPMLEEIWASRILTNEGPFHRRLEARLRDFLRIENISLATNGMVALEAVIDAAGLEGEIVTTPYSFVATTHAVKRGRLEPVFVDIRPEDLNIDPDRIEAAITSRTSAIVAVHCYGNPCAVEAIEEIAQRRGLKVIYDAAHAFGVTLRGESVLGFGDFATLSFHATKAFNTFEGGAVIARATDDKAAIDRHRNFGIADEVTIPTVGTNAKMSEFNAAVGLLQLDHFEAVLGARRAVDARYREMLADVAGIAPLAIPKDVSPNFSYFPVLVGEGFALSRDALYERLKGQGIHSRRYFHPLLSNLPMYRDLPSAAPENLPVANRAAAQILCLPIYPELSQADQARVVDAIRAAAQGG
jgi:dTDP-4-amino-4,6-dideoxygalactose transaminase